MRKRGGDPRGRAIRVIISHPWTDPVTKVQDGHLFGVQPWDLFLMSSSFLGLKKYFNWSITALQYCLSAVQQCESAICILGMWDCQIFPGSSVGKESACSAGDPSSIPGSGRSPGEGTGYPLQYSWVSLVTQLVKDPPAMQKTWVQSLG